MSALVKQHHYRRTIRGQSKGLFSFRNHDGVAFRSKRSCNFHLGRNPEQANPAFELLCLLRSERHLVLPIVIRVAQIKLRRSRAIHPLREKLVDISVRFLFDRFRQIRTDHVLPAICFQIVLQPAIECVFSQLMAQHIQHQPTLAICIAIKFA